MKLVSLICEVLEVNATDTVQANTVILVNKATSIISGQVLDFDGVAIPDAIITAVSDVGDILITESNLFMLFDFQVEEMLFGLLVVISGVLREE